MLAHFHFTYKDNILQLYNPKLALTWAKFVTFNLCECYFLLYLQKLHLRKCHFRIYFNSLKLTHELSSLTFYTKSTFFVEKYNSVLLLSQIICWFCWFGAFSCRKTKQIFLFIWWCYFHSILWQTKIQGSLKIKIYF